MHMIPLPLSSMKEQSGPEMSRPLQSSPIDTRPVYMIDTRCELSSSTPSSAPLPPNSSFPSSTSPDKISSPLPPSSVPCTTTMDQNYQQPQALHIRLPLPEGYLSSRSASVQGDRQYSSYSNGNIEDTGRHIESFIMSILGYNGGAVVAMTGKDCVAIASDLRFGVRLQTISTNFEKVFQMGPHLFLGLPGLATDTQTVHQRLRFRLNLYELRENRRILPKTFAAMVSNLLYERRFGPYFIEPVIAGLDPESYQPYICNMDLIGCVNVSKDFVVCGTCEEQLYGMCETLWKPDMKPDEVFEAISQALVNAFDRDAVSGWGAVVHVIEKDKITTRRIKTRMD
ncbi:unnamed protein product [Darwinula stevensoni]|uniref:Proteasome subunit beta type-3 n=1 Tax=Darwinula stevensoni TaxID=69355 RepID=A0A7R9A637_9CRUS|nr:unnamed protein product [Darwinula stevensoni]CAG0887936.1 unnamed protein product [Darwinula stevensoni]